MSPILDGIVTFVSLLIPLSVGLGIGASSTVEDFALASKKPIPVLIGLFSQFCAMPLISLALIKIFEQPMPIAVGVVLVGTAPGGTTSNLFTYFSQGDTALSVTMSLVSTIAAFGMMPFWNYILMEVVLGSEQTTEVPMNDIAMILAMIIIPTGLGLSIRHYNKKWKICGQFIWKRVEQLAACLGAVCFITVSVTAMYMNHEALGELSGSVWIMSLLLQVVGSTFGFVASKLLKRSRDEVVAISIEAGVQNVALAIAIANLSLDGPAQTAALMFPLAYAVLPWPIFLVLMYRYGWPSTTAKSDDCESEEDEEAPRERLSLKLAVVSPELEPSTDDDKPEETSNNGDDTSVISSAVESDFVDETDYSKTQSA